MVAEDRRSPTLRRRRLAFLLRKLRAEHSTTTGRKETTEQVTKDLGWSAGKLTRLERAESKRPNPRDIADLLDYYEIADERQREEIIGLARDARERGPYSVFSFWSDPYADMEFEAQLLRSYQSLVIPGLLQTDDYARGLLRGAALRDRGEIENRVVARAQRKQILERAENPTSLWAVIDEAALHKPIGGPAVMRDQIEHLISMTELPHVSIQVLPDAEGAHAGMAGQFVIMDFPDPLDPSLVYLESAREARFLEEDGDLAFYDNVHREICASALSTERSVALLERYVKHLSE